MRVAALLCLILGFVIQGLLDGQTFTHAVLGIVFGAVAVACGLASARNDPPHRLEGYIMAFMGLALGIWCIIMLPSAYRFQEHFNQAPHDHSPFSFSAQTQSNSIQSLQKSRE